MSFMPKCTETSRSKGSMSMDVSGEQTGDATSDVDVRASVGCIVLGRVSVAPVMWTSSSDTFGES